MGYNWKTIAGPLNWKFSGEVLDQRRSRLEAGDTVSISLDSEETEDLEIIIRVTEVVNVAVQS